MRASSNGKRSISRNPKAPRERFTYLGPLGASRYLAAQIGYGHGTLLVNTEDLNDATSVLVTRLTGDVPALDLQCLGRRTAERSFGVTFKRWATEMAFDIVLVENGRDASGAAAPTQIPVRFERNPDGAWIVYRSVDLEARGFECRQRGTRVAK